MNIVSRTDVSREIIRLAEKFGQMPVHWRRQGFDQLIDLQDQIELRVETLRAEAHALLQLDMLSDLVDVESKMQTWMTTSIELDAMMQELSPDSY